MILAHRAAKEFWAARTWYQENASVRIAEDFVADVKAALLRASHSPLRCPIYIDKSFRWIKIQRFPYLINFRVLPHDRIEVVAVAHERRQPGYWKT